MANPKINDNAPERTLEWIAGPQLIPVQEANKRASQYIRDEDQGIKWGGVTLSSDAVVKNFLFAGQIESGKTLSLKMLMRQALRHVGRKNDWRGVVYDDKGDLTPFVYGLDCPTIMLNPFDTRSASWAISEDITEFAHVDSIVSMFIAEKEGEGNGRFFSEAARQLMEGVMKAFLMIDLDRKWQEKPLTKWTLRDVCLALQSEEYMKQLFRKFTPLAHYEDILSRNNNDVIVTLRADIRPFTTIASLWFHADQGRREPFSIKRWLSKEQAEVLILNSDDERHRHIQSFNRVLLGRLMQLILKQKDSRTRRTWIFLDEFSNIGQIVDFDRFITKSRSKGASVSIAFQNFSGVIAEYGEDLASKIITECGHKAFLRGDGPYARWSSEYLGNQRMREIVCSYSESGGMQAWDRLESRQSGTSEHISEIPVVRSDDFCELHKAGPDFGLSGYYYSSEVGKDVWLNKYASTQIEAIIEATSSEDKTKDREAYTQILTEWNDEDLQRLDLQRLDSSKEGSVKGRRMKRELP
jgi:Type IV secretion-system coupling protein DNA-binding domain